MRYGVIACLVLTMSAWAQASNTSPDRWSTRALLFELIRQQSLPLDLKSTERGCGSALSPARTGTVGDYLSFLMAHVDPSQGQGGVRSSCSAPDRSGITSCEVMFQTGLGTEDPWSYGLRFKMDANKTIDAGSLSCPGGS